MPMCQLVVINFAHPGYGNAPIFDDPSLEYFGESLARKRLKPARAIDSEAGVVGDESAVA
jgi:hypothetical protein